MAALIELAVAVTQSEPGALTPGEAYSKDALIKDRVGPAALSSLQCHLPSPQASVPCADTRSPSLLRPIPSFALRAGRYFYTG